MGKEGCYFGCQASGKQRGARWHRVGERAWSLFTASWRLAPERKVCPLPRLYFLGQFDFPPHSVEVARQCGLKLPGQAWEESRPKAFLTRLPTGCGSLRPINRQDRDVRWPQADLVPRSRTSEQGRGAGSGGAQIPRTNSLQDTQNNKFFKLTADRLTEFVLVLNTPGTKSF